jgi:hypothetical protein
MVLLIDFSRTLVRQAHGRMKAQPAGLGKGLPSSAILTQANAKGGAIEVGKGVIDIPGVLRTLVSLKFPYHVALEYEANAKAPMPGIKASFEYMRKVLAEMD